MHKQVSYIIKEDLLPMKTKEELRFGRILSAICNHDYSSVSLKMVLIMYKALPTGECTESRLGTIYELMEKYRPD